ncbi:beta/gamma crystallin family protein [Kibdelosporangium philippinense]|uniref:Beta/gamma crystallin family protein n=1 Tax=Kibdelosporangium philippinense TaxID=211113 RepID=A0ABS8ZK07_9PSEU|nr:beta/gamma crystallin family protein [Kibdelosporangium philippinense]MCE7008138.1 beta/gamma crystallin family protein [Kibdelosporangium philippinense]
MKRRTKLAIAAVASVGAAIAGGQSYLRRQFERGERLGVTLYSEPNYRGKSQTLTLVRTPVCALSETGLSRVGSIKVQRLTDAIRPAVLNAALAVGWVRSSFVSAIRREFGDAVESGYNAAGLALSALDPESWRVDRDLADDRQSWVRLWADEPVHPAPPQDDLWYDVVADTPDLGPWSARTRYLELGVRTV